MARQTTAKVSAARPDRRDRPVVYHGLKIPPVPGRRSSLAKDIRKQFEAMAEKTHGEPAQA